MKKYVFYLLAILALSCAKKAEKVALTTLEEPETEAKVFKSEGQNIPFYTFDEFESELNKQDDKTYVVNFWATWCKPCVKELPSFEKLNAEYTNKDVEVILVSMDFFQHIETKLIPFVDKYDLQSQVVVLDDAKSHKWIPKVSPEWSGAIPATVIYNRDTRKFYERSFTYTELETEVKQFLN